MQRLVKGLDFSWFRNLHRTGPGHQMAVPWVTEEQLSRPDNEYGDVALKLYLSGKYAWGMWTDHHGKGKKENH